MGTKKLSAGVKHSKKKKSLRKELDKKLQSIGRKMYDRCLVCGGEYSCLHHYYTKGSSTYLRYDLNNCIPLCVGCHFKHHNGNPDIHNAVNDIMGIEWREALKERRMEGIGFKPTLKWYKDIEIIFEEL